MYYRNRRKMMISMFILAILVIGIGYAYLTSNLSINGTTEVVANTWDIHFANVQEQEGSVDTFTPAVIDSNDNTKVNFAITLSRPGDFYEFTVDVVNAGTIDGMIESITSTINNTPISNLPSFLDYSLTYSDGIEVDNNHLLEVGNTETYRVKIEYKMDINTIDLLQSTEMLVFKFSIRYIQANENAEEVNHELNRIKYKTFPTQNLRIGDVVYDFSTFFDTVEEAKEESENRPNYLKYVISDSNIIKEIYACFEKNGKSYCLRGFITYDINNNQYIPDYYDSEKGHGISPYYESNVAILKDAFGEQNCALSNDVYRCSNSGLSASVFEDGYITVYYNDMDCGVDSTGDSNCGYS